MTRNPRPIRLTHRPYAVQADTVVVSVGVDAIGDGDHAVASHTRTGQTPAVASTLALSIDEKALEMAVLEERLEMKQDDRDEAEREQYVDRLRMAGLL